jgi:cytochrome c oxidase cbb3-type subunit 3
LLLGLVACDREQRRFREAPPSAPPSDVVRLSTLQPGQKAVTVEARNDYQENAFAVSEGQRLFGWYNCSGCHANGGGGMGPPLMDDKWIYGSAPDNIYHTIVEGRPNGMPSFSGRIPGSQVWQLVAYVRSLSGLASSAARSSRSDHMMVFPGSNSLQPAAKPKQTNLPPAAVIP